MSLSTFASEALPDGSGPLMGVGAKGGSAAVGPGALRRLATLVLGAILGCDSEPSLSNPGVYVLRRVNDRPVPALVDSVKLADGRSRVAGVDENGFVLLGRNGDFEAAWIRTIRVPGELRIGQRELAVGSYTETGDLVTLRFQAADSTGAVVDRQVAYRVFDDGHVLRGPPVMANWFPDVHSIGGLEFQYEFAAPAP